MGKYDYIYYIPAGMRLGKSYNTPIGQVTKYTLFTGGSMSKKEKIKKLEGEVSDLKCKIDGLENQLERLALDNKLDKLEASKYKAEQVEIMKDLNKYEDYKFNNIIYDDHVIYKLSRFTRPWGDCELVKEISIPFKSKKKDNKK